jgi:hypothetical protein
VAVDAAYPDACRLDKWSLLRLCLGLEVRRSIRRRLSLDRL